jgi:uncharacterized protein involved in exopolysaccharide biosynthesis
MSRSSLLSNLAAGDALSAISRTGNPLNTQMEIIKTDPVMKQVIEKLSLMDAKGRPMRTGSLRKRIKVMTLGLTDIIEVNTQSTDPWKAADIANAIGEVFVLESQKSNQREAQLAREFIESQLKEVQAELSGAEIGPGKGVNLLQGKRMATVAEKTYVMLLEKYEEARIAEAVRVGYARIIEPAAIPTSPVKPKKMINTLIGGFFGLMLGLSLAFLFEYMDDSIKTPEDAKRLLNLPVLGMIPHFDEEEILRRSHLNKNQWGMISFNEWKRTLSDLFKKAKEKVRQYGIKVF